MQTCPLCNPINERVLWSNKLCRIIGVDQPGYAGYCRVIWHDHVREMTDLSQANRNYLMHVVWILETVLRDVLSPEKINLASFGNYVPHLHWHVIPRFKDDPHFPDAMWATAKRAPIDRGEFDWVAIERAIEKVIASQLITDPI